MEAGCGENERAFIDAVVRALLTEDTLLRLPLSVFKDNDETWSAALLHGMYQSTTRLEPLAARIKAFLEEMAEIGPTEREARLFYATRQHSSAVELVTGATKSRPPIFNAFNTPLLPDILICTQVGQEGIDLHRQCRHVVHYDLGWNPATLEQRTGRVDRIGSKAFRERKIRENTLEKEEKQPREDMLPGLEIAIPYLAGTYDERIFDCLRSRAQIFDILTGGDPFLQGDGASPWLNPDAEGIEADVNYVPLPETMLGDLRVNLAVPVSSTDT